MTKVWIKPKGCRLFHLFTRNASMCLKFWRSRMVQGVSEYSNVAPDFACKECWRKR